MRLPKAAQIIPILFLTACASGPSRAPEVRTVEVRVPVAVACDPKVGPKPSYPDTDEALKAAAGLFPRVQLLLAGRELRKARETELEAGLDGCKGAAPVTPPPA